MIKPGRSAKARRARSGQPGKAGIVRLYGAAMKDLWTEMWNRDRGHCCECRKVVAYFECGDLTGEMAHIKARGAGGSDTLDNVRLLCRACHRREHVYGKAK